MDIGTQLRIIVAEPAPEPEPVGETDRPGVGPGATVAADGDPDETGGTLPG